MFILYKIYNKNNSYFSTIVYPFLNGIVKQTNLIKLTRRLTREWNEQFMAYFRIMKLFLISNIYQILLWNVKIIL